MLIDYFIKNINSNNKNSFNLVILIIFICFISLSSYKSFFKSNWTKMQVNFIEVYFKGNQKLKDLFFLINKSKKINSTNIIFGNYVAKDLFYSYFYEHNKNENIDYPAINSLYNKKNNKNYLNSLDINFEKLYSTYYFNILFKEKNIITDPTLDKLCKMRIYVYNDCGNLKKLELFMNNKPVKDVFYNGSTYSIFFYKIEPKQ